MMRMGIQLSPEIESVVHRIYAGGQYASEAEVIAAAFRLLQQREQLRTDLRQGCDELDRGDRMDAEEVFAELPDLHANIVHDAATAILMREHGIRQIVTRDTDFHRFPFLEVVDPVR